MDTNTIILNIKSEITKYTGIEDKEIDFPGTFDIQFLEENEFLAISKTKSLSEAPGAFYNSNNNTVYMLKKENYNNHDIHKLVHETLHALSNFKNYGKEGFLVNGYDENNKLISAGGVLNEAATEYITSIVNKDGFIGYPDDMKYIFEIFIDILNIKKDFIKLYFQKDNWITDSMNNLFNEHEVNQLDEFVLEFDNRLPMYRKKGFDFNKVISILIGAIFEKISNKKIIDYKSVYNNLLNICRCNFDLNDENIQKINYIMNTIRNNYVEELFIDDIPEKNNEDGKITLGR